MMIERRSGMPLPTRTRATVFAFFLCFFVLISSGRLGSYDAFHQLSSTTLLVTQHRLGTAGPPGVDYWIQAPNGLFYEPHDAGAVLLMAPAAWVAAKLGKTDSARGYLDPPLESKFGVSMTYAVIYAIGSLFLFMLFAQFYTIGLSFAIALAFSAGSYFTAYAKVAWDVAPCAAAMCVLLYYACRMLRDAAPLRDYVCAGLALGVVGLIRYSVAPGLVIAVLLLAWQRRERWREFIAMGAAFTFAMLPTFVYNIARTGSPIRPATAVDYYVNAGSNNALDGNILHGLAGLLFGPNRSIFLFSPILLIAVLLPFIWRRVDPRLRVLMSAMLTGTAVYAMVIAKMSHWGAFGWGARYLLPCLPIMFLAVGVCFAEITRYSRRLAALVLVAAFAFNLAPLTTNWHVVAAEYAGADAQDALAPKQLEGIWKGFWRGLNGEPLVFEHSDEAAALSDPGRRFPDFWTVRLMERSRTGAIVGTSLTVVLLAGMALAARHLRVCAARDGGGMGGGGSVSRARGRMDVARKRRRDVAPTSIAPGLPASKDLLPDL